HGVLAEPMLVQPVFDQIYNGVYQQIQGKVDAPPGNSYPNAKSPLAAGWNFAISNTGGDDAYVNNFTVVPAGDGDAPNQLRFDGAINIYEEDHTNMGFCTARAWGSANVAWVGDVTLAVDGDGLGVSSSFSAPTQNSDTGTNSCADVFGWLGKIFGGMF